MQHLLSHRKKAWKNIESVRRELQYFVGIDFGVTSCGIVVNSADMKGHIFKRFHLGDSGRHPTRSVVAVHKKTGETITGTAAWEQKLILNGEYHVFTSVLNEIMRGKFKCKIKGKRWDAMQISVELLHSLRDDARQRNFIVERVIMAIPASVNSKKREILRQAAVNADMEVVAFISEPKATFIANYNKLKEYSTIVVLNLSYATIDITVLKHELGKVHEVVTGSLKEIGEHINEKLARCVHDKILKEKGKYIIFDEMPYLAQEKIRIKADNVRLILSEENSATLTLNSYGDLGCCKVQVDYGLFKDITDKDVNEAIVYLKRIIIRARENARSIDKIVLLENGYQLRLLKERLITIYGEEKLLVLENGEWNVAEGAALYARIIGCGNHLTHQGRRSLNCFDDFLREDSAN